MDTIRQLERMEESILANVIYRANLHKKTISLWYNQIKRGPETFNTSLKHKYVTVKPFVNGQENPQIKFKKGLREKRS